MEAVYFSLSPYDFVPNQNENGGTRQPQSKYDVKAANKSRKQ